PPQAGGAGGRAPAAVWAAGLGLSMLILRPDWLRCGGFWLRALAWLAPFGALGGYYVFTLMEGYRATISGGGGLLSMGFGFYELIGMSGLGPGRDEIRANPMILVKWLPLIAPTGLLIAAVWVRGCWYWWTAAEGRQRLAITLAVLFPLGILIFVGLLMDFRVLGRHMSPLLAVVLLPLALALEGGTRMRRCLAAAALGLLITSCLLVRISPRHARNDFRSATNLALDAYAEGRTIWWQADMNTARYYAWRRGGLPMVYAIQPWETGRPDSLLSADLVVINRPEIHASGSDYRRELRDSYFEPIEEEVDGFEIWRSR
ncbi:MAG: hypothetical protein ACO3RV_00905, partial [Luteolibacter sp.]